MNKDFNFTQKGIHAIMDNFYYFNPDTVFSEKELQKIEKDIKDIKFNTSSAGQPKTKSITLNERWKWFYEKIEWMVNEANDCLWNFDLYSIPENIQYIEHQVTDESGHDWKMDSGRESESLRKISVMIQLSDSDEYEGGDLEIFRGGPLKGPREKAGRRKGTVFVYPSYMMNRVAPVTKGVRKSFVLWVGGEHYK